MKWKATKANGPSKHRVYDETVLPSQQARPRFNDSFHAVEVRCKPWTRRTYSLENFAVLMSKKSWWATDNHCLCTTTGPSPVKSHSSSYSKLVGEMSYRVTMFVWDRLALGLDNQKTDKFLTSLKTSTWSVSYLDVVHLLQKTALTYSNVIPFSCKGKLNLENARLTANID